MRKVEKVIRIGIIGAGVVAERVIKALHHHPVGKIVGIYDNHRERMSYVAGEYQLPEVESYQMLLENQEVDLIYLAVPPKYHHPIAMDIIRAKKHLICEKPLANSIEEAKEMFEAAQRANIVHAMNFPTIYTPAFKRLKELLDGGFMGDIRRVELQTYFQDWPRPWQQNNWIGTREQGGFVREVFTHYIQMIQQCFGLMENIHGKVEYPADEKACETGIVATATLPSGVPVLFNGFSNVGQEDHMAFTLYGTEGTVSLVNWRELWISARGKEKTKVDLPQHDHLRELIEGVFSMVNTGEGKIITFEEGYHAQRVIEKLLGNV